MFDKTIHLPVDYTIVGEHALKKDKFEKIIFENSGANLNLKELKCGEFRVFELQKF